MEHSECLDNKCTLARDLMPLVVGDLVSMVMKKKALGLADALHYIYRSQLYGLMQNDNAKMWYYSTTALYDILEEEKRKERALKENVKVLTFKVFCVEEYCQRVKKDRVFALNIFDEFGVFDFLGKNYDVLHTQDAAYIVDSIVDFLKNSGYKR